MRKKISLVQPNFRQGPKELNAYYLPYSVGVLWAYATRSRKITETFKLDQIVFRRDPVDDLARSLAENHVVAFSTYIWNRNYNYALASRIKALNPDTTLIFGGPEIPVTSPNLFEKLPFADVVVRQEGEISFREILEREARDLEDVPGLIINVGREAKSTGNSLRIQDLDSLPSPYLDGVFDDLIAAHPEIEWNGTLETNRGCPYQCTFCDWGSLTYNKIKKFEPRRVYEEIDWFARHGCGHVSITDANFGIFPKRDEEIVDHLLDAQKQYGFPYSTNISWAKNQRHAVVSIAKKVTSSASNRGLTLSFQSLDPEVLRNIKRSNLPINDVAKIFEICDQASLPVASELILGLPGETVASWKRSVFGLLDLNQHSGIEIFQAQLLENAEMNISQKERFSMESVAVYDYMSGSYDNTEQPESVDVVVGHDTLSFDDMLECHKFNWFLVTMHIFGFSQIVARFLKRHHDMAYEKFYEDLRAEFMKDHWFAAEQEEVEKYYTKWMQDGRIDHPQIAGIDVHGWNLGLRSVLKVHAHNRHDAVFDQVEKFTRTLPGVDQDLLHDVLSLQRAYVVRYETKDSYPIRVTLGHNLYDYIVGNDDLRYGATDYVLDFPEDKSISLRTYLERFYFSRRRNYGKVSVSRQPASKSSVNSTFH